MPTSLDNVAADSRERLPAVPKLGFVKEVTCHAADHIRRS